MVNILDYTDDEIRDLALKVVNNNFVVLHEQWLTKAQHIEACKRFGKMDRNEYSFNPVDAREISIVSGQRDEEGRRIGMFGEDELEWHQNGSARHEFEDIIVSLYCVEECIDTVLSVCSQVDCFAELPNEIQEKYRGIDIHLDFVMDAIYNISEHDMPGIDHEPVAEVRTGTTGPGPYSHKESIDRMPLVGVHPVDGREYLYFALPFMVSASYRSTGIMMTDEEFKDFYDEMWGYLFKSKYMQHHVFRKGDLLIMDQLHTIHRRSPIHKKERQLWRTAFDYTNIKF
jgi:hypothetical protein|tara:strand:+ start:3731 stop:4588 length:858 start_codon:yes stop_codon:yes gene_type:complete